MANRMSPICSVLTPGIMTEQASRRFHTYCTARRRPVFHFQHRAAAQFSYDIVHAVKLHKYKRKSASARRFTNARPPPGAYRCFCLTAHIFTANQPSHTPRSPADRPAQSVPRRKAAKCLSPACVRSSSPAFYRCHDVSSGSANRCSYCTAL